MNITTQRLATLFNEWYAENHSEFSEILDENGNPVKDYGESCALYFQKLQEELL